MKQRFIKLVILLLLAPHLAWASETAALESFFESLETLQCDFKQRVYDGNGAVVEQTEGTIAIRRPGQFRWITTVPYQQEVIGDGERIWIYDPDLEQVTVRRQKGVLNSTPAHLLTQQFPLREAFNLETVDRSDSLQWIELKPLQEGGGFERLMVAMAQGALRQIEVEDSIGQRTEIILVDVRTNRALSPQQFQFVPPAGVDIVGDY